MHKFTRISAAVLAAVIMAGCGNTEKRNAENVDLNSMSIEEITEKAKAEGEVNSVGMPDDWANWEDTWKGITEKYGLKHTDVDLSSAEELSMFESEKKNATKDIGDVGETYGAVAEEKYYLYWTTYDNKSVGLLISPSLKGYIHNDDEFKELILNPWINGGCEAQYKHIAN